MGARSRGRSFPGSMLMDTSSLILRRGRNGKKCVLEGADTRFSGAAGVGREELELVEMSFPRMRHPGPEKLLSCLATSC